MRLSMARQPLVALRLRRSRGVAMLVPGPLSTFRRGALVISALLLAACAPADSGTNAALPPPSAAFDWVDADGDGAVEVEEWDEAGHKVFDSLDKDRGGSLSAAELEAGFDSLDLNRDGVIDKGEADIASLDTDGDGVISRAEWHGDIIQLNLDINGDGSVSREEFEAHQRQTFATADRNGNQRIERIELAPEAKRFTLFKF
jgi:Ca2+-binding EF-hand superfamily protein